MLNNRYTCFCSIPNILRKKGTETTLNNDHRNFVNFLFAIWRQTKPNLKMPFLNAHESLQQMSRSTVYCLSFTCFFSLFQFQWDFRRKTWTHKLTYAKKKKWEYHKNEITVEPNEIHQMCISNMNLASHERPSLDSMSNQWFIYNR